MKVIQLSVSKGGIPKRPVAEAILTPSGITGDSWAHAKIHGGPNQAVLLITQEGLEVLIAQGFPLYPGALGENITTQGLARHTLAPAQRYRIGTAIIELTKVREPCQTLEVYGKGIRKAIAGPGLSGFYARVIEPATVYPGDVISLL